MKLGESLLASDPAQPFALEDLLAVTPPPAPADFDVFWRERYALALQLHPRPRLKHTGEAHAGYEVYDLRYISTGNWLIRGWVLVPQRHPVTRAIIFGHGYGGCDGPDYRLSVEGAALFFPCFRGLARSQHAPVSSNPLYHVLHDIDKPQQYIIGGCVEDLWLAVSSTLLLFPAANGHIGYAGISFGGGIGALALPWDNRIQRAHFNVPTFGHQPLRLQLPTRGSAAAVQAYGRQHGNPLATLQYYDAATAARFTQQPVHIAAALCDPMVTPPGQFAIYNALSGNGRLFVLDAGHMAYPRQAEQEAMLLTELQDFFADL